jgi:hypothetical protein
MVHFWPARTDLVRPCAARAPLQGAERVAKGWHVICSPIGLPAPVAQNSDFLRVRPGGGEKPDTYPFQEDAQ